MTEWFVCTTITIMGISPTCWSIGHFADVAHAEQPCKAALHNWVDHFLAWSGRAGFTTAGVASCQPGPLAPVYTLLQQGS